MIKSLHLKNFQSHKNSELEFDPRVNVIVGESDHGKTAIMRAIYWLVFGKPAGDSMRRNNTVADCKVSLKIGEDCISRIRGSSTNCYEINEIRYTGFGQSVPEPVTKRLNLSEINFMRQLDPPFLFSKTAGDVAQYLNRLINLDIIDTSLSNIKRMHTQAESQSKMLLAEVSSIEHEIQELDWIDEADTMLSAIEVLQNKISEEIDDNERLEDYVLRARKAKDVLDKIAYAESALKESEKLLKEGLRIEEQREKCRDIKDYLQHVCNCKLTLREASLAKIVQKNVVQLEFLYREIASNEKGASRLQTICTKISDNKEKMQKILVDYKKACTLLQKGMPDTCPLCEQEIKSA